MERYKAINKKSCVGYAIDSYVKVTNLVFLHTFFNLIIIFEMIIIELFYFSWFWHLLMFALLY